MLPVIGYYAARDLTTPDYELEGHDDGEDESWGDNAALGTECTECGDGQFVLAEAMGWDGAPIQCSGCQAVP
jgi:hypothetical protein